MIAGFMRSQDKKKQARRVRQGVAGGLEKLQSQLRLRQVNGDVMCKASRAQHATMTLQDTE